MTSKKIAIIGAGVMGKKHAQTIARHQQAELIAICDPFSDVLAQEYKVAHYQDLEQLFSHEKVDGVIIANPNRFHVSTAITCMQHGVACLLEKPLALDTNEALQLIAAQNKLNIPILVGHHRRHNKIIQQAKKIIDQGILGDINTFNVLWSVYKPDHYFDIEWHRKSGAGVLAINLVHDLDLMRYLNGEIESVQAMMGHKNRHLEVEDTISITLRFKNGALAALLASDAAVSPWGWDQNTEENKTSFASSPDQNCYFISGSEGALSVPQLEYWNYPQNNEKSWSTTLVKNKIEPDKTEDVYISQLSHFIDVIDQKVQPISSAQDAIRNIQLLECIEKSARENRTIFIESLELERKSA
ncbi:Gfo/Idh/MocA family oxidoreductase [Acinetobacter gerneri]|uniref:Gfo/Idh/MocA family oxidoreductase n=1 Tax=Acinetobacter gerneri TaxID=202952 RepID=A0AAW8JMC3_9GAMM|nr:Gfo/Idh/MocA family oxidoreductase [Acinetobacter gerneri]MDQ9010838.1 Gfo/Idh/MocA family oxidoreductase [Acinetobacter gerneri]MDQ9014974.1 Gfo/Idh/MocA family oxidoreductase [Acinetobacter gerneri]MDQ9026093.1 Gfo/Idh/MocA family oxidoreductase [Acinetobacter gerneri]MDQ9053374.1 Gfo/Idh/MocA family oxidoreductase [Acinetobacter gerneri]MDQ9061045.1 Gfo/Idh/MocA family oxidoreductase [Acinetobacter gerneri]